MKNINTSNLREQGAHLNEKQATFLASHSISELTDGQILRIYDVLSGPPTMSIQEDIRVDCVITNILDESPLEASRNDNGTSMDEVDEELSGWGKAMTQAMADVDRDIEKREQLNAKPNWTENVKPEINADRRAITAKELRDELFEAITQTPALELRCHTIKEYKYGEIVSTSSVTGLEIVTDDRGLKHIVITTN